MEAAKITFDLEIEQGGSDFTAGPRSAAVFLSSLFGGPWEALLVGPSPTPFERIESMLCSADRGALTKFGKFFLAGTVRQNKVEPQLRRALLQIPAVIEESFRAASQQVAAHELIQQCCAAVRGSDWNALAVNEVIGQLFNSHKAHYHCASAYLMVTALETFERQGAALRELLRGAVQLMIDTSGSECRGGFISLCNWITNGRVTHATRDEATQRVNACDVGLCLTSALAILPASDMLLSLRGMCALGSADGGKTLSHSLAYRRENGHLLMHFSHAALRRIGDLIYGEPQRAKLIALEVASVPDHQERVDIVFWMLDHPEYGELAQVLRRHSPSARAMTTLRTCCEEDPQLAAQLCAEIAGQSIRAVLVCELAEHGAEAISDVSLRREVYTLASNNPGLAPRLVKMWAESLRDGAVGKAGILGYLWATPPDQNRDLEKLLRTLPDCSDADCNRVLVRLSQATPSNSITVSTILKELPSNDSRPANPAASMQTIRRADPIEARLLALERTGNATLADEIRNALRSHPILRRTVNTVLASHGSGADAQKLARAIISPKGQDLVLRLLEINSLRAPFRDLLTNDLARALAVIEQGFAVEHWEETCRQLLQTPESPRTPQVASSPSNLPSREGANFGIWRSLRRVIIVGSSFSNVAQQNICRALPGKEITFLDNYSSTNAIALLQGTYDIYVLLTRSVSHTLEILSHQAQRRNKGAWYPFHFLSAKLIARELQLRFGILAPGAAEE